MRAVARGLGLILWYILKCSWSGFFRSSLSVIREQLGPEIYQGIFEIVLTALKAHGLFKVGILGSIPV